MVTLMAMMLPEMLEAPEYALQTAGIGFGR